MHNNYTTIKYKFYTIPHILSLKTRQSPSVGRWRKPLERDRARERAFRGEELFRAHRFSDDQQQQTAEWARQLAADKGKADKCPASRL